MPLAITALSGNFINKVNMNDIKDLVAYTPGVTDNSQDSFIDAISVRGVRTQDFGVGGDPSSAFFKNDLYEGRNSIGGAFSVHTRRAELGSDPSGYAEIDIAERGRRALEGAVNLPVSDHFGTRLAGYYSTEDGFANNEFPGSSDLIEHDKWALRWSTNYERDRLMVRTMVEYEDREQSGSVYRAVDRGDIWEAFDAALGGVNLRGSDEDIDVDRNGGDNDDATILTLGLHVDYDLDFATFTSNTGYKDHDYYNEDYDGTPLVVNNYGQDQTGEYFQQEFRLTSSTDGPLSWYAGVSYYEEKIDTRFSFSGREDVFCQYYGYYYNYGMAFSGWATYINANYFITDSFDVELGLRYTKDKKDFSILVPTPVSELGPYWAYGFSTAEFISDSKTWDDVTTRVLAKWRPTDERMFFAGYTEGFKSGGFGSFNLANNDDGEPAIGNVDLRQGDGFLPNIFEPETVDSWEIGYEDTLMGGRANVDLYLAAGYLDSEATELQDICGLEDVDGCEGSPLFWAPEWSAAAVLSAHFPVSGGVLPSHFFGPQRPRTVSMRLGMIWD